MCLFLLGMILQLFMFCWNGNEMSEASELVAQAAYNSQWVPAQRNVRKLMLLTTLRAQRPVYLTAGKFSRLSMATYATVRNYFLIKLHFLQIYCTVLDFTWIYLLLYGFKECEQVNIIMKT